MTLGLVAIALRFLNLNGFRISGICCVKTNTPINVGLTLGELYNFLASLFALFHIFLPASERLS